MYNISLGNRRALVTGSSRGIGKAIAKGLLRAGCTICLNGRYKKDLKPVAKELSKIGPVEIHVCDLSNDSAVDQLALDVKEIDILVLNAALQIRKAWSEISKEDINRQVAVNLQANLKLLQAIVPGMEGRGWGRVILVSSIQHQKPHPQMMVYASLKSGLINIMHNLAGIVAKNGVTINAISPGVIATEVNRDALTDPIYRKKVLENIPVGRFGEPEDCVGAALFLCAEESSFVTGIDIPVNGGGSF